MSTDAQIDANRRNARNSTGPRTPEGKAKSSANSVKHGLSGAFRVLDTENQEEFEELIAEYHRTFRPANIHERFLIEEIAQARWRLARARRLESELIEDLVERRHHENADDMFVSAFRTDTTTALNTIQRYANVLQRAAFRAQDQLLALRRSEARAARDAARQNEPNPAAPLTSFIPSTPSTPSIPFPPSAPSSLTPCDTLAFYATLRGVPRPWPGLVHAARPRHLHRKTQNLSALRPSQNAHAPAQTQLRGPAQRRAAFLGTPR
jgi:hypothetical protein